MTWLPAAEALQGQDLWPPPHSTLTPTPPQLLCSCHLLCGVGSPAPSCSYWQLNSGTMNFFAVLLPQTALVGWTCKDRKATHSIFFFSFSKNKPVRSQKSWRRHYTCLKPIPAELTRKSVFFLTALYTKVRGHVRRMVVLTSAFAFRKWSRFCASCLFNSLNGRADLRHPLSGRGTAEVKTCAIKWLKHLSLSLF